MHAIVPNAEYFKPFILKFKTFIYNITSKIISNNFGKLRENTPFRGKESFSREKVS